MQRPRHYRSTRRSLIASAAGLLLPMHHAIAGSQIGTPQASPEATKFEVDLGDGMSVTDFRIVPEVEPARFLIEIQSHRDDDVDTPVTGAYTPGQNQSDTMLWCQPWFPVLRAGTSNFATGVLPRADQQPDDMTWMLCNGTVAPGAFTKRYETWRYECEFEIELLEDDAMRIHTVVTNTGTDPISGASILTQIRDESGRVCGAAPPVHINLQPNQTLERSIGFSAYWEAPINPFRLCDKSSKMDVTVDLQPSQPGVVDTCPAVMPWNRTD